MQTIVERGFVKYFVAAIVFLTVASVATFASAETDLGLVGCDGVNIKCDFCAFIKMVLTVSDFVVGLLIIVSVIMLAWTGIQMAYLAAGGSDAHQVLKERMTNIVIGFLLIIAAWTIIDTVLLALIPQDDKAGIIDMWREKGEGTLCKLKESTPYNPTELQSGSIQ